MRALLFASAGFLGTEGVAAIRTRFFFAVNPSARNVPPATCARPSNVQIGIAPLRFGSLTDSINVMKGPTTGNNIVYPAATPFPLVTPLLELTKIVDANDEKA